MTTLSQGQAMLLEQYTPDKCPDKSFREKMFCQIIAITTGKNVYLTWLSLSKRDKKKYRSVENHPWGIELCLEHWENSEADRVWGDEYG
jgi:hypothetical protein